MINFLSQHKSIFLLAFLAVAIGISAFLVSHPTILKGRANNAISASPNPCLIPSGASTCSTTVTWQVDDPNPESISVYVNPDPSNQGDMLQIDDPDTVNDNLQGSHTVNFITQTGYTFRVYKRIGQSQTQLLASVTVTGSINGAGSPTPTSSPTPTTSVTPTGSITPTSSITPTGSITPTTTNGSVTPTPTSRPTLSPTPRVGTSGTPVQSIDGDFNNDNIINELDFSYILRDFNKPGTNQAADVNHSGRIDEFDWSLLIRAFLAQQGGK